MIWHPFASTWGWKASNCGSNLPQASSEDAGPSPQARAAKCPAEEPATAWAPSPPPVTASAKEEEEEEEGDKIMAELQVCGEVTDHGSQPFPPGTLAVSLTDSWARAGMGRALWDSGHVTCISGLGLRWRWICVRHDHCIKQLRKCMRKN